MSREEPSDFNKRGTIVLEDLTGDGVTDAVLAEKADRNSDPRPIRLMLIDGQQGKPLWHSKLNASKIAGYGLWPPAVYGEPASEPGKIGKLFCIDFEAISAAKFSTAGTLRLNSIDPMTGGISRTRPLQTANWDQVHFHRSLDESLMPALLIEPGGDLVDEAAWSA